MQCNVKLRKLLSAHKSHVRETSLFTGAVPNPVRNSQTFRFGARSKSWKVKSGSRVNVDAMLYSDCSFLVSRENDFNQGSAGWCKDQHELHDKHAETTSWTVAVGQGSEVASSSALQETICGDVDERTRTRTLPTRTTQVRSRQVGYANAHPGCPNSHDIPKGSGHGTVGRRGFCCGL